jgi:hypothetical protein
MHYSWSNAEDESKIYWRDVNGDLEGYRTSCMCRSVAVQNVLVRQRFVWPFFKPMRPHFTFAAEGSRTEKKTSWADGGFNPDTDLLPFLLLAICRQVSNK